MRSSPQAYGRGFGSPVGSMFMTIGVESGDPTATAPSCTTNATFESPLIAIACASVAFKRKPLIAIPQVREKVPPYVVVRSVAVATTTGSGAGATAIGAELESRLIAETADVLALTSLTSLTGVTAFCVG